MCVVYGEDCMDHSISRWCTFFNSPGLNSKPFCSTYVEKAYSTVRQSDGDVKPGGPLGAFREEQAMSRHRVSSSPFLSPSSHTTQLHYTNTYTYSHPNLNFLQYTIQILVPHIMWSARAVHDSKKDHIQCHLSALCGTQSA